MKVILIDDAPVLIPNPRHKNFTATNEIIEKGTELDGDIKKIEGERKGERFVYRLFRTKDGKLIFLNKTKPKNMEKTEVTLGADAAQSPTKIKLPSTSNIGARPLIGAAVGLVAAYFYAKKKGFVGGKKWIHYGIGAVAGFAVGKYLQSQRKVVVTPSK